MRADHSSAGTPQEPDMIQVAVVDDHPIARIGLEHLLEGADGVKVAASAADPEQLPPPDGDGGWDVVLLDLYHRGDQPCLDAVRQLSAGVRVLVVSASARPGDVVGAIRAGASGYVTKNASASMVLAAVRTVAAGGFALSSQLADILQAELGRSPRESDPPQLSLREEEALMLIARGFTHGQVATRMGVSKSTVDTYVERIRAKLQVGNKAELTRAALERMRRTGTA